MTGRTLTCYDILAYLLATSILNKTKATVKLASRKAYFYSSDIKEGGACLEKQEEGVDL